MNSKQLAYRYLNTRRKIRKYIKEKSHSVKLGVKNFVITRELWKKFKNAILKAADIAWTGLLIKYCLTSSSFFAYGLITYLAQHYLSWLFIQISTMIKSSRIIEKRK